MLSWKALTHWSEIFKAFDVVSKSTKNTAANLSRKVYLISNIPENTQLTPTNKASNDVPLLQLIIMRTFLNPVVWKLSHQCLFYIEALFPSLKVAWAAWQKKKIQYSTLLQALLETMCTDASEILCKKKTWHFNIFHQHICFILTERVSNIRPWYPLLFFSWEKSEKKLEKKIKIKLRKSFGQGGLCPFFAYFWI